MTNSKTKWLTSIRWSINYIMLIPALVCGIVIWLSVERINDFEAAQKEIAGSVVITVSQEVGELISNYRRLVRVFTRSESELIRKLANNPEDEQVKARLNKRIADHFPDYFTFTIANRSGVPLIDDFEGNIGDICIKDMKKLASGIEPNIQVHPNSYVYHIDIMSEWGNKQDGGIFFISFHTDFIASLLRLSSPARHELMLINTDMPDLIEITEQGARINLERNDFHLTEDESKRILASVPIAHTHWMVVDLYKKGLIKGYQKEIVVIAVAIIILFLISSVLIVMLLMRTEKNRILAESVKQEMFSLFNHDLRSPLAMIFNTLQILNKGCDKVEPERYNILVSQSFENAKFMLGIVNDILDLQKMEAGRMEFDFANLELVSLIEKTISMNRQFAEMNGITINFDDTRQQKINIQGDAKRIQQALMNLLSNAIKYSPDDGVVSVMIETYDRNVKISVTDNGPGIPADFHHLVFEKFAQSKKDLKRKIKGTGLGLAIVKYIVEQHNGEVGFVSQAGKGTTFYMELPYHLNPTN